MAEGERRDDIPDGAGAQGTPGDGAGGAPPPPLDESLRAVSDAGRATLGATADALRSLRALFSADIALARSALGRGIAWAGVAVVFGASAWLLITGALIALMQRFGFSWLQSLSLAAFVSLAMTAFAAWRVSRYFDYTGMHATRRQLSQLNKAVEIGERLKRALPDYGSAPYGRWRATTFR